MLSSLIQMVQQARRGIVHWLVLDQTTLISTVKIVPVPELVC